VLSAREFVLDEELVVSRPLRILGAAAIMPRLNCKDAVRCIRVEVSGNQLIDSLVQVLYLYMYMRWSTLEYMRERGELTHRWRIRRGTSCIGIKLALI
jgi:hypothetical protein